MSQDSLERFAGATIITRRRCGKREDATTPLAFRDARRVRARAFRAMVERHLVLRHLDASQPHPFLRLWERWGLGEGGGEWAHPPPPPRLAWDEQPSPARLRERRPLWRAPPAPPLARRPADERVHARERPAAPREPPRSASPSEPGNSTASDASGESSADGDDTARAAASFFDEEAPPSPSPAPTPTRRYAPDELRAIGASAARAPPPETPGLRAVRDAANDDRRAAAASAADDDAAAALLAAKKAAVRAEVDRKLREAETRAAGTERAASAPSDAPRTDAPPSEKRRAYTRNELRALRALAGDGAPPGFDPDPRWTAPASAAVSAGGPKAPDASTARRSSREGAAARDGDALAARSLAAAKAAASAASAAREAAEAEAAAARAAVAAALRADAAGRSLWPREGRGAAGEASPPREFREPRFLAESLRVAGRIGSRAAEGKGEGSEGGARDGATEATGGDEASVAVVDSVVFPPGALVAFSELVTGGRGGSAFSFSPGGKTTESTTATLAVVHGAWTRTRRSGFRDDAAEAGAGPEAAGPGRARWRLAAAFLQPWDGSPRELASWLETTRDDSARSRGMIAPCAWLRATHALAPAAAEEIFAARRDAAKVSVAVAAGRGPEVPVPAEEGALKPPPPSAVFISLDVVRTALSARGAGGGARVEVFDLRDGAEVEFEVWGADDDDERRRPGRSSPVRPREERRTLADEKR